MLAPPLASTVSSVMSLDLRETIPIVFFGFAICSCVITLIAKMGAQYSISFPVLGKYFESPFPPIPFRRYETYVWNLLWVFGFALSRKPFRDCGIGPLMTL